MHVPSEYRKIPVLNRSFKPVLSIEESCLFGLGKFSSYIDPHQTQLIAYFFVVASTCMGDCNCAEIETGLTIRTQLLILVQVERDSTQKFKKVVEHLGQEH